MKPSLANELAAIDLPCSRCDGFGYCAEILPEVLSLDEWGFPKVRDRGCPREAVGDGRTSRQVLSPAGTFVIPSRRGALERPGNR